MEAYLGQIAVVAFNFAPYGWALCNGQLLPISQNTALFSLLGTTYGGDGRSSFGLPNLQGAMALGFGQGAGLQPYVLGEAGGEQTVTLLSTQMPAHNHTHQGTSATQASTAPNGNTFGETQRSHPTSYYVPAPTQTTAAVMAPAQIGPAGGSLPHSNMMPYLVLNFVIALRGEYPARS